ncbi:hypothetical protein E3N88_32219 [Mikania micrantha]|uniref:Uncharacterized protein n=1 Tax=Mikania micrantha TaxID=192012 RepID=A0A5N6M7X1_9ASTR|nr:hypothetical protein E3N88_32219 [Mikania micrantha]
MNAPAANELQQQLAEANARWAEQQRINGMMQQQINKHSCYSNTTNNNQISGRNFFQQGDDVTPGNFRINQACKHFVSNEHKLSKIIRGITETHTSLTNVVEKRGETDRKHYLYTLILIYPTLNLSAISLPKQLMYFDLTLGKPLKTSIEAWKLENHQELEEEEGCSLNTTTSLLFPSNPTNPGGLEADFCIISRIWRH